MEEAASFVDSIMRWVVAPVAAFVWLIYMRQQDHHTDLAVLKAEAAERKTAHERELKEIRDMIRAIFNKLDSIEEALRK
jgi:hypothetical protein